MPTIDDYRRKWDELDRNKLTSGETVRVKDSVTSESKTGVKYAGQVGKVLGIPDHSFARVEFRLRRRGNNGTYLHQAFFAQSDLERVKS